VRTAPLSAGQRLLIEYKPFEPAFYHTDIADWGMSLLLLARAAGPQAKGSGRYRASLCKRKTSSKSLRGCCQRTCWAVFISTISRYADDDSDARLDRSLSGLPDIPRDSLSSSGRPARPADIAYMVDQSHNLKGKIEE
jgi:L-rhamnose isomerase / sugar isomerase